MKVLFIMFAALSFAMAAWGQKPWRRTLQQRSPEFFKTEEARRVGDQILLFQRNTGGWAKNLDMVTPLTDEQKAKVLKDKTKEDDSTTDNGATSTQMAFLARLYKATGDKKYRDAVGKGIEYLLSGQYENGGWPQFWPVMRDYQVHITFNDNAMVNTMNILRSVADMKEPYDSDVADKKIRKRAEKAWEKGVECILKCQIVKDGVKQIWCQQHDRNTYLPAKARAYELPSYSPQESAAILGVLMSIKKPSEEVKTAIHSAMRWLDDHKITGLKVVRTNFFTSAADTKLVEDSEAAPIWARYYDLEREEPYVCDRDGLPRRRLESIGRERRNGYSWFDGRTGEIYELYDKWADKYDPARKVAVSLKTKGGNETGRFEVFRAPKPDIEAFDVVVNEGESIQKALDAAPADTTKLYKVYIRKGVYNEKVVVDRPNILMMGEDKETTIIRFAEIRDDRREPTERNGVKLPSCTMYLTERAADFTMSNLTVENNYGSTVKPTTTHQMAVFGRATRTIIVNCKIKSDGNDALALWAKGNCGMYYHADLDVESPGVDFLCPRGWCYVTRSRFMGDSRAILWHDGRGDKSMKLVVKDSDFDAKSPTPLGRYHHDSQFFLLNCHLSENILDQNIAYAYTDKVLDPCPWGRRTYYYSCLREGGDSGWLRDNLKEVGEEMEYHTVTAEWTFDGKWNPEARLRALWHLIAY
ncbi:MAG: pectate lyase [Bacteroidales bacterium]|nr:pectate lyase [Bacteroidales bacterium]